MSSDQELEYVHLDFKREYDFYKSNRKQWLKDQKIGMSQFSVEVNPEPSQDLFVSLGRLLWCSSLFEEKLTRAVFWLSSLYRGELSDLPGQGVKLSSRIGQLNKLLHENIIVEIVGVHSVEWTRETMKGLVPSIEFRDDVVHGHHQGNWYPDHVFRAPGKSFHVESSKFTEINAKICMEHAERYMEAAALLALYDSYFFELEDQGKLLP